MNIRPAQPADLVAINDIYNHYVRTSTCTYQTEDETIEARRAWFANHGEKHPIIVAEIDGVVVGWGSLSPFHRRAAYQHTVEHSVYVHHEHHRKGIGRALLARLIELARERGHHTMIGIIDASQEASLALHDAMGFLSALYYLKEVGCKFGRWLDVVYVQLMLDQSRDGFMEQLKG
jgi:phosphinothricin acetyltransferase